MTIDNRLDAYAADEFNEGQPYPWWWNASTVIADAVSSACLHLVNDGTTAYTHEEIEELLRLACLASELDDLNPAQEVEFLDLLTKYFLRLWD